MVSTFLEDISIYRDWDIFILQPLNSLISIIKDSKKTKMRQNLKQFIFILI
jgi:hypothetical protein